MRRTRRSPPGVHDHERGGLQREEPSRPRGQSQADTGNAVACFVQPQPIGRFCALAFLHDEGRQSRGSGIVADPHRKPPAGPLSQDQVSGSGLLQPHPQRYRAGFPQERGLCPVDLPLVRRGLARRSCSRKLKVQHLSIGHIFLQGNGRAVLGLQGPPHRRRSGLLGQQNESEAYRQKDGEKVPLHDFLLELRFLTNYANSVP